MKMGELDLDDARKGRMRKVVIKSIMDTGS